jgi:hypothetical protein
VDIQKNPRNGSEKLNVILHGAYVFDQTTQPDRILALIPEIGHHSYRAGSWLAETELRGRAGSKAVVYKLEGVNPGKSKFSPGEKQNLMVQPRVTGQAQGFPFATLVFPLPQKITSLAVADIPRTSFTHPNELVADGDTQHLATLQVFTYEIKDQNALMLKADDGDGHYWEPVLSDGHVNLHIFSAEEHFYKPSNAEEDFNKSADLLGGLNLRLQTRSLRASGILDGPPLPDGVDDRETEGLARRTERMARLGRLVLQKGGDANVAWYGNDALDGDPSACAGPVR